MKVVNSTIKDTYDLMNSDAIFYLEQVCDLDANPESICKTLKNRYSINIVEHGEERALIKYGNTHFKIALNMYGITSNKRSQSLYNYTPIALRKYLAKELVVSDRIAITECYDVSTPVTCYEVDTIIRAFRRAGIILYDIYGTYQWGRNNGTPILLDHTYWKPVWMSEFTRYRLENIDLERLVI